MAPDANATDILDHPLALRLIKLFACVLLFVPAYLSALLYTREQNTPPSFIFFFSTAYGLFGIVLGIAGSTVVANLSPSCRLIEPFAVYLVVLIGCLRLPKGWDRETAVIWLGFVVPLIEIVVWNYCMGEAGRKDRLIDRKYFDEIFNLGGRTKSSLAIRAECLPAYATGHTTQEDSPRMKPVLDEVV
ncbi:hypothetical protein C8R44DRAFT_724477 [Mycena epipterygia]|nr:hypothetical protein C8R44DRAFT_724477 [Mycena epipterygia]